MKVLHITLRADFGGGPEHVYKLVEGLKGSVECYIASPFDYPYGERFESLVSKDNYFRIHHRVIKISDIFGLRRFILNNGIDIVHSHGKGAGLLVKILRLICRFKLVHTYHGYHEGEYGKFKRYLYSAYERYAGQLADANICVSAEERNKILEKTRLQSIFLVNNGVSVPEIISNKVLGSEITFGHVTRYDYQKNSNRVIAISLLLTKAGIHHKIYVAGVGEGLAEFKELVGKYGVTDYIDCLGGVDHMADFYADIDMYISTSRWEGLPLSVLEAMSYGVPCVLSSVIGHVELAEQAGSEFCLFDDNDVSSVAAVESVASNYSKCSFNVRELVKNKYSVENMVGNTIKVYEYAFGS